MMSRWYLSAAVREYAAVAGIALDDDLPADA